MAKGESRKVPGISTSPITFTWMVRMLLRVMLTVELGLLPPTLAYLDTRARRSFSRASLMVRPPSCTWPIWLILMVPSGEMVLL